MVEYAIALFNGTGVTKDEAAAAALLQQGRPQGQPDRAEPARPHPGGRARAAAPIRSRRSSGTSIAKAGGASDLQLDEFAQKQKPEVRAAAEKAAQPWLEAITASRS